MLDEAGALRNNKAGWEEILENLTLKLTFEQILKEASESCGYLGEAIPGGEVSEHKGLKVKVLLGLFEEH